MGPNTTLQFVGTELDSVWQEARLPLDKLTKCCSLLNHFHKKCSITLHELVFNWPAELLLFCCHPKPHFFIALN